MRKSTSAFFIFYIIGGVLLSSCGGGGSQTDSPSSNIRDANIVEPDWVAGQFADKSVFENLCESPRLGPDSNGDTFSDSQGTAMHEKMWMRSWTDDTYLWYNEVDDNDPSPFTVANYFEQLKTNELTLSGASKDNFHFSQSTEDYNQRTQSGVESGYGISWEFVNNSAPRRLIVRYTEPNSPAAIAGVSRGFELKTIDGIDFINADSTAEVDRINAALFPSDANLDFNFEFTNSAGNDVLNTSLVSANIEIQPVQNVTVLDTAVGKMGYMQFNSFIRVGQDGLIEGFQQFVNQGISELVIDMRYNGGGLLAMASQLAYMVAGSSQTNNQTFETLQFNDKHPNFDPVTGNTIQPTPFFSREIDWDTNQFTDTALPSVELTRVFVLATENTCSASEAVINGLRGIDVEVVLIGDTTCGKPYGFYPTDNCSTTYFTIQFQGVNNKGFGEYSDGFKPSANPVFDDQLLGCDVADDFSQVLGTQTEALLASAITYAQTGSCPVSNKPANKVVAANNTNNSGIAIKSPNTIIDSMKILTTISEPPR